MSLPLISVLMVNYNHEGHIGEAIESVLSQTHQNIQFIIVDDGSTDHSREIIEKYSLADSRIEYYPQPVNRHICHATNFGFQKVKGEYLARIDSDDLWYPDKLEKQLHFIQSAKDCRICFSWIDLIDQNGTIVNDSEKALFDLYRSHTMTQEEWLRFFFFIGNNLCHSSVLMETSLMRQIGRFHLAYRQAHDFDYWIRASLYCQIHVIEEPLVALRRFINSELKNTSSSDEVDMTRFYNEFMMIRSRFFDQMPDELFIRTFHSMFRNTDSSTLEELECEKAFLLCNDQFPATADPVIGLLRLERLLYNPDSADLLERTYDFTPIEYYKWNGVHLYYDHYLKERLEMIPSLNEEISSLRQALSSTNASLEETAYQLNTLQNSACWKLTRPIRFILDKLKGGRSS